jgi:hypothetical protein
MIVFGSIWRRSERKQGLFCHELKTLIGGEERIGDFSIDGWAIKSITDQTHNLNPPSYPAVPMAYQPYNWFAGA